MLLATLSGVHILLIVLVIVLLFGAGSIPKLARSIGRAKNEFEKGLKEGTDESAKANATPAPTDPATPPPSTNGKAVTTPATDAKK